MPCGNALHDFRPGAVAVDHAFAQHEHLVRAAQKRRAVRDDDDGDAVVLQPLQRAQEREEAMNALIARVLRIRLDPRTRRESSK